MCYSGGSHPATATRASRMVMMICFIFILVLFQPFLQSRQFVVEVVEALQLQIVADTAAVGGDGFVVEDAVEVEKFLHTGKAVVGEADVYLVGQPLIDIFVVSFATLSGALLGNEDELYIICLFRHPECRRP